MGRLDTMDDCHLSEARDARLGMYRQHKIVASQCEVSKLHSFVCTCVSRELGKWIAVKRRTW